MKVHNINSNNTNFKSGLTYRIVKDIAHTDIEKATADFAKIGLDADFKGKKSVCANFIYAINILYDIAEKYKLPFDFVPYSVRVYKQKELLDESTQFFAFSINDTGKVLKDEPSFIGGSIFINDFGSGTFANDYYTTIDYLKHRRSTPHFLANTLHEWFHTIQMHLMYQKYGYGGKCPILSQEYDRVGINKGLQKYENLSKADLSGLPNDFKKYIGKYGIISNSKLELFAELMTKIVAESLDKKLRVVKNPLDNLPKDLPKEIKSELERIMDI